MSPGIPTRPMDKLGGDLEKIYYLEWHMVDGSSQVEYSNTLYLWPAFF